MKRILNIFVGALLLCAASTAKAEDLVGRYLGVEDAAGAQIDIRPDSEGFVGTFYDAAGQSQQFEADRDGDTAEAVLDMDNRTVLLRMAPLPYGAEVAFLNLAKAR